MAMSAAKTWDWTVANLTSEFKSPYKRTVTRVGILGDSYYLRVNQSNDPKSIKSRGSKLKRVKTSECGWIEPDYLKCQMIEQHSDRP